MPDKKFKLLVIKIFTGLERNVDELSKNFSKEIKNMKVISQS